jgi:hypothetical protein
MKGNLSKTRLGEQKSKAQQRTERGKRQTKIKSLPGLHTVRSKKKKQAPRSNEKLGTKMYNTNKNKNNFFIEI